MYKSRWWISLGLAMLVLAGCDPEFKQPDKYARPDWLAGKVYTQLKEKEQLSTFAQCVELSGYDTIIDRSGSYTVFAPNNQAFTNWFANHPVYNKVEDIPLDELVEIVKFHIVQNPWTKEQLRTLDVYGWIDTLDINNDKPRGFKRQTLLLEENRRLGVIYQNKEDVQIVDTLESDWHRVVATDSRKYVPIFFSDYFGIYDLQASDYQFYFNRTIDSPQDLYFANGKIIGDEIFAENGFVYEIDQVVDPMPNAYELLEAGTGNESFSGFLDLVNLFPSFSYNEDKTMDQPGYDLGYEVDSLFDLSYPQLTFNLLNEKTIAPRGTYGLPSEVTIRYHHGMVAPTNTAFDELINTYIAVPGHWGDLKSTPMTIKRIIANTHLSANAIYPTDFTLGYYNGEKDLVTLDEATIIDKKYGSNCSFIAVNEAIVPRVFNSVAGPIYLRKGYSRCMYAIEEAGLLSALKREGESYQFFVESNSNCNLDSSLLYRVDLEGVGHFSLFQVTGGTPREYQVSTNDLRILFMNHIALRTTTGIPRKEFLPNLAGNYIIIDNITGEASGTANTTHGYRGSLVEPNYPILISTEECDNGRTYDIGNWFSFSSSTIYRVVSANFHAFDSLLVRAGLANTSEGRYTFLSENEDYTVFAPNDSVARLIEADSMELGELQNLLKLHFVQGDLIFTDGVGAPGYYETARKDESSTAYTTIFSKIYIDPGIDLINIRDRLGGTYVSVEESESANRMAGRTIGSTTGVFTSMVINGVVHEIDRVLDFENLDTN